MNRIVPIVLIAALLVLGGIWLSGRNRVTANSGLPEDAESGTSVLAAEAPEGFLLTPPLSDEPEREFEQAEQVLEPNTDYQAVLETSKGTIVIDLYEEDAPVTVNNFVFLARHRYYDGVVFHRVLEDFMAQTGDPTGTGSGGPGYQFDNEIAPGLAHDQRGVVSMANAGPDTNGSQFFITFGPTEWLDGGYNIFGQVVSGDEVLDRLQRINPQAPSAVVSPEDPLSALSEQGVDLAGAPEQTVESYLVSRLGALPSQDQTFEVDGVTGVLGRTADGPAIGFFPKPDVIERLYIVERPRA